MAITKSLIVLAFLVFLSTGFSAGTWAFFNDNEASNTDQMVSGTLDLKTDDNDGTSKTLKEKNLSLTPGESSDVGIVALKNSGNVAGSNLDISFSYVESDGVPNAINMSENQTAAVFEVILLDYDGTDLLAGISDNNSNGYIDVQDITNADLSGQSGIGAGATKNFSIELITDNTTSTDFANDGIDITMSFLLNQ
jgi:predicted ribosomally synthesized peptide with SipW-like signal peptide